MTSQPTANRGFGSDNHSGVHPTILEALMAANGGHAPSYGTDPLTRETSKLFQEALGPTAEAFFVFNGTASNVLCLESLVQPHQSILCGITSHLWLDECGAPERYLGSKLVPVPTHAGKLRSEDLEAHLIRRGDQHFAQPGALSITQPTELGTTYSIDELEELIDFARKHALKIHIDGARLGNAASHLGLPLRALAGDLGIDALSFGGTKNGLLGAEAVVLFGQATTAGFRHRRKQAMQLPSKTRFIAAQFSAYLRNDLWKEIASHANHMAKVLHHQIATLDTVEVPYPVESNAVFALIPKTWVKPLRRSHFFYVWETDPCMVRLMTSFDTTEAEIAALSTSMAAQKRDG